MNSEQHHKIFTISGPSGAGKTTLAQAFGSPEGVIVAGQQYLCQEQPQCKLNILQKVTTRPRRPSDGIEISTLTPLEYADKLNRGDITFHHILGRNGYSYGVEGLETQLSIAHLIGTFGNYEVLRELKNSGIPVVCIYVLASIPVLYNRLAGRQGDPAEIQTCRDGIEKERWYYQDNKGLFDHTVENNGIFDNTFAIVRNIINNHIQA